MTETGNGAAVAFSCPGCGERLRLFMPASGPAQVMRQRDIPREDAGEGVEGVAGDPAGASGSEGDGREGDPGE